MDKRITKLLGNTSIFAIGSLSSKLLVFLLLPIYTNVLTTSQYGEIDLFTTSLAICIPLLSLSIFDAVFRWLLDKEADKVKIISSGFVVSSLSIFIAAAAILIGMFANLPELIIFSVASVLSVFQSLMMNIARGFEKVQLYVSAGLINTFSSALITILGLLFFKMGQLSYYLGIIAGLMISIVILAFKLKIWQYIKFNLDSIRVCRNLLMYSVPLIPNAISWWLTTSVNRYFIIMFLGINANGLFSVSTKIPAIMTMIFSVFSQAWQISSVQNYESQDKSAFYSTVLNRMTSLQLSLATAILALMPIISRTFIGEDFYSSWKYVPLLLLSVIFSNLSSFVGTTYIAAKSTMGLLKTTMIGGVLNIALNLIFVPIIGIYGACLCGVIAFLSMFLIRVKNTSAFVNLSVDWWMIARHLVCVAISSAILYISNNNLAALGGNLLVFMLAVYLDKQNWLPMYSNAKTLLVRRLVPDK